MKVDTKPTVLHKARHSTKNALLVLGMHRSGTSLLAGILDRLGCKGPKTPVAANDRNPKGYFESEPLFRLNDEILAVAGARWSDWQPLRENWHTSPRFNEFRDRATELIGAEYGNASLIYLKDPRLCRLLPFWRTVLEEMGFKVACLLTHRHPVDVAASLKARTNIEVEPAVGMLTWLRHVQDAELASRDLPRVFTSYDALLPDWQPLAVRVTQALDFTWPVASRAAQERMAELVNSDLRHYSSSVEDFLRDPLVPEVFQKTLRVLERWSKDGEDAEGRDVMDQLRCDFDHAAPLLYAPLTALEAATRDNRALALHKAAAEAHSAEIKAITARLSEADSRETELSNEIKSLTDRIIERDKRVFSSQREMEQLREDLAQLRQAAHASRAESTALSKKISEADLRETQLSAEIETLTDRVIERDKRVFSSQREMEQLRENLAQLRQAADASRAESTALSKKISEADLRETQLSAEIETLTDRIIERDKKVFSSQREMEQLRTQTKVLQAKLEEQSSLHTRAISALHHSYKTSTSWKISAPIRLLGRMVKKSG